MKKKPIKPKRDHAGRPTKWSLEIQQKLFNSFLIDCTVQMACVDAEISQTTFNSWCRTRKGFLSEMLKAKLKLHRGARQAIAKEIAKGNYKPAQWFLEHRESETYAPRIKHEVSGSVRVLPPRGEEPHPFVKAKKPAEKRIKKK